MDMIRLEKELYGRIRAGKRLFEGWVDAYDGKGWKTEEDVNGKPSLFRNRTGRTIIRNSQPMLEPHQPGSCSLFTLQYSFTWTEPLEIPPIMNAYSSFIPSTSTTTAEFLSCLCKSFSFLLFLFQFPFSFANRRGPYRHVMRGRLSIEWSMTKRQLLSGYRSTVIESSK